MAKITGIYRSAKTGLVTGTFDDGSTICSLDWTDEQDAVACAARVRQEGWLSWPSDKAWLVTVDPSDFGDVGQGTGSPDPENQGDGDGDRPDQGDGDQGNQGDDGDQQGDQGDQGDQQGDDGDDGSDEGSDDDDEQKDDGNMEDEFEAPPLDDQASTGNAMADEIWTLIAPLVDERDQAYAGAILPVVADFVKNSIDTALSGHVPNVPGDGGPDAPAPEPFKAPKFESPKDIRHHLYPTIRNMLVRGIHVYAPGPPGTGKSHMAEQIARELDMPFAAISLNPQMTDSKIRGYKDANGVYHSTSFRIIFENGGLFLVDEMDNGNGALMAGLNSALANGFMDFPDGTVHAHPDFIMMATANTLGTGPTASFAGRQKIDPASLNRFAKVYVDTDEKMEDAIVNGMLGREEGQAWLKRIRFVRRAVDALRMDHFVTMRDSIIGAKLIAPGDGAMGHLAALEHTCLGSLTPDQRDKIKAWKG